MVAFALALLAMWMCLTMGLARLATILVLPALEYLLLLVQVVQVEGLCPVDSVYAQQDNMTTELMWHVRSVILLVSTAPLAYQLLVRLAIRCI